MSATTKNCNATADEIAGISKALDLYCEAHSISVSGIQRPDTEFCAKEFFD